MNKAKRLWKRSGPTRLIQSGSHRLIVAADQARDHREYRRAAELYEQALAISPGNAAIHIQCGHMHKEARSLARAEEHYVAARKLTPDDPDLALQLGHFYKTAARLGEAVAAYERALALSPGLPDAERELEALRRIGFRGRPAPAGFSASEPPGSIGQPRGGAAPGFDAHVAAYGLLASLEGLAPEVAPRHPSDLTFHHPEAIHVHRFGRGERTRWGMLNTLRGVEALRFHIISTIPILSVEIVIDGIVIHREGKIEGVLLKREKENRRLRKYAYNIWYDFGNFVNGRNELEIRFNNLDGHTRIHREFILIAAPLHVDAHPGSDGLVEVSHTDKRSIEEQINAQPSMVRPAARTLLPHEPRNVMVMRVDQLGDMVCSVPAIRRLREIFPRSRLVGLIAPANQELEASLKLFDEVVLVDFPDDPTERRRLMTLAKQEELRVRLVPYQFDLAIDMSDASVSRPLLFLSGAPALFSFRPGESHYLTAGYDGVTRDFVNGLECQPHTNKMMGFVEWIGTLATSYAKVERRDDLARSILSKYGIAESEKFVVFHTGARIAFSRWPHYDALSALVLKRTGLKVVMLSDDPGMRARLGPELTQSARFQLLDERLTFDEFDALVSYCSAFVGNDSGPKHLASLRGANVVSVHLARNNWNEWGQELSGYIVSRRVPCAGCSIHHEPEECGKAFACITNIKAEEVYGAIAEFL